MPVCRRRRRGPHRGHRRHGIVIARTRLRAAALLGLRGARAGPAPLPALQHHKDIDRICGEYGARCMDAGIDSSASATSMLKPGISLIKQQEVGRLGVQPPPAGARWAAGLAAPGPCDGGGDRGTLSPRPVADVTGRVRRARRYGRRRRAARPGAEEHAAAIPRTGTLGHKRRHGRNKEVTHRDDRTGSSFIKQPVPAQTKREMRRRLGFCCAHRTRGPLLRVFCEMYSFQSVTDDSLSGARRRDERGVRLFDENIANQSYTESRPSLADFRHRRRASS